MASHFQETPVSFTHNEITSSALLPPNDRHQRLTFEPLAPTLVFASEGFDVGYKNTMFSVKVQHYRVKRPFVPLIDFRTIPIVKLTVLAAAAVKIGQRFRKGLGDRAFCI